MQFHWRMETGHAVLTGCEAATGRVIVPETVDGLPVAGIESRAFLGASELTEIELPPTLTFIQDYAFLGCAGLRSIEIPDSATHLGAGAFEGCVRLRSLRLSNGLLQLPARAFYLCKALESVDIPPSVKVIGESAFSGCEALRQVTMREGLETISPGAFAGCSALRAVRIPRSVTRIDADSLPVQLRTNGDLYLPGSGLLVRAIARLRWQAPAGTRIIADGALAGNHDLTEVTLPETVISIGSRAFADCRCLHAIHLPEAIAHIGTEAFRDCGKLAAIALPNSLDSLSDSLFEHSGLKSLDMPPGLVRIGNRAFASCTALRHVRFNPALHHIGALAFAHCSSLKSLTLPEGLRTIGPQAFLGCDGLETLTLPGDIPEGLEDALTDLRRVAIIAPMLAPEAFPPLWRKRVCLGFAIATQQGIAFDPGVREANLAWISAHASTLGGDAAVQPSLLRLMLEESCLSEADARRLIDRFSRQKQSEWTVELLHYLQSLSVEGESEALW